jgi:hypothetical protein
MAALKQKALVAGGLVGLMGVLKFAAPMMVPADTVLAALTHEAQEHGLTLTLDAQSLPEVSVGLSVRVVVHHATLAAQASQSSATIDDIELVLPLAALGGSKTPESVVLRNVTVQVPASQDHSLREMEEELMAPFSTALAFPVMVENIRLLRNDATLAEGMNAQWLPEGLTQTMTAKGTWSAQPFDISFTAPNSPVTGDAGYRLAATWGKSAIGFDGTRNAAGLLQGKWTADVDPSMWAASVQNPTDDADASALAKIMPAAGEGELDATQDLTAPPAPIQHEAKAAPAVAASPVLAMKASGELYLQNDQLVIKSLSVKQGDATLQGEVGAQLHAPYNVQANLSFDVLDTAALRRLFASGNTMLFGLANALHERQANAAVLVRATRVQGQVEGTALVGSLSLKEGVFAVENMRMQTAGDGVIGLTGALSYATPLPAFQGTITAQGKAFHAFLPAVSSLPLRLPAQGFGAFAASAALRVSSDDVRFADIRAKIENTVVNAAYINQFSAKDIGVRVALSHLDMDAMLGAERERALQFSRTGSNGVQTAILPPYVTDILKSLDANYNIYVYAQDYQWGGKQRDPVEVRLKAGSSTITLDQFSTRMDGADVFVTAAVDLRGTIPKVAANLTLGDVDAHGLANYFGVISSAPSAPTAATSVGVGQFWSNAIVPWGAIPLAEGSFTVRAKRLLWPNIVIEDANFSFDLANEKLRMKEASMRVMNADVQMRGELNGGALPSWQWAASIANLELAELGRFLPYLMTTQGRISISTAASSSGASPLAQAQNLKASMAIAGRGIQLNQFDVDGAAQMLRELSSVDLLNAELSRVLPLANTRFDTLDGNIGVNAGAITISRIALRSPRFVAEVTGQGSVPDWRLTTQARFPLSIIQQKNPPTLVLKSEGPLDGLVTMRDDTSLIQYISNKTANELIQGR